MVKTDFSAKSVFELRMSEDEPAILQPRRKALQTKQLTARPYIGDNRYVRRFFLHLRTKRSPVWVEFRNYVECNKIRWERQTEPEHAKFCLSQML